jgi:hypothetical protein
MAAAATAAFAPACRPAEATLGAHAGASKPRHRQGCYSVQREKAPKKIPESTTHFHTFTL